VSSSASWASYCSQLCSTFRLAISAVTHRSVVPFAIDGPLKLRLVPTVDVSAEHVRLGNVQGGSQPKMVEIGKAVVQIGLWSLISGPPLLLKHSA
jgi:uncharacterized protein involved in outer membrane biogenesis